MSHRTHHVILCPLFHFLPHSQHFYDIRLQGTSTSSCDPDVAVSFSAAGSYFSHTPSVSTPPPHHHTTHTHLQLHTFFRSWEASWRMQNGMTKGRERFGTYNWGSSLQQNITVGLVCEFIISDRPKQNIPTNTERYTFPQSAPSFIA